MNALRVWPPEVAAAQAAYCGELARANQAHAAIWDPAQARMAKETQLARMARDKIPAGEVAAWLNAGQRASEAFQAIETPARAAVEAVLAEYERNHTA